jgi:hypothetical protein
MIVELGRGHRRYRDLTPHRPYVVIGIEADHFRILNDQGRPFLYPARIFRAVDRREPGDWISEVCEEGERYGVHQFFAASSASSNSSLRRQ